MCLEMRRADAGRGLHPDAIRGGSAHSSPDTEAAYACTDGWTDAEDVAHTCLGCCSAAKMNELIPFVAAWLDLEMNMLSEISQRKTNTHITYMWTLQYGTNDPIYATEIDSRTQKAKLRVTKGRRAGNWGIGD